DLANDHLAGVEAQAGGEAHAMLTFHFSRVASDLLAQLQRRIAGALGVIFMSNRGAEQGHDTVASVLVHRALQAMHTVGENREETIENLMPLFGIKLLGQLHRALHIGEQYGDLFALAFKRGLRLQDFLGEVFGRVGNWGLGSSEFRVRSLWSRRRRGT